MFPDLNGVCGLHALSGVNGCDARLGWSHLVPSMGLQFGLDNPIADSIPNPVYLRGKRVEKKENFKKFQGFILKKSIQI